MTIFDDPKTDLKTIARVEDDHVLTFEDGEMFGIGKDRLGDHVLRAGDRILICGSFGRPVRGVAVGDPEETPPWHVLWYETEDELNARLDVENAENKRHRREKWEQTEPERKARIAKLPESFRRRMELLRDSPTFWDFEDYELSCCEDGAAITAYADGDLRKIADLHKEGPEGATGKRLGLFDGHSGNSWGFACFLARAATEDASLVPRMHGALCQLVGCEDYDCPVFRAGKGSP